MVRRSMAWLAFGMVGCLLSFTSADVQGQVIGISGGRVPNQGPLPSRGSRQQNPSAGQTGSSSHRGKFDVPGPRVVGPSPHVVGGSRGLFEGSAGDSGNFPQQSAGPGLFGHPSGFGGNGGCHGGQIGAFSGYGPSGFPSWGMSPWPGMIGCGPRVVGMGPWGTGFGYGSPAVVMVPATVVVPVSFSAPGPYIDDAGFWGGIGTPVVQAGWTTAPFPAPLAMGIPHDPLAALLEPVDEPNDLTRIPAKPSSTAGKLKCLENLAFGDEKMRKRKWSEAYLHYRTAVNAAGDQANAHFRLAVCYIAMNNFDAAIRSFKRSVFLDPALPQTCDTLEKVFGPDSLVTRSSVLNKVGDWLKVDIRNPDRLFLLAVLLHCEREPRSRDVFEAAQRMSEGRSSESREHITAFLSLPVEDPNGNLKHGVPLIPNFPPLPAPQPEKDRLVPDKGTENQPVLIPPLSETPTPPK